MSSIKSPSIRRKLASRRRLASARTPEVHNGNPQVYKCVTMWLVGRLQNDHGLESRPMLRPLPSPLPGVPRRGIKTTSPRSTEEGNLGRSVFENRGGNLGCVLRSMSAQVNPSCSRAPRQQHCCRQAQDMGCWFRNN
jgi:hypothetical protein